MEWINVNGIALLGVIMVVAALLVFGWMACNRDSKFDFAEMFEGDNGKTSMGKFSAFIGTLAATWVVAKMTFDKTLTDLIFTAYIGTLVIGKVASEWVANKSTQPRRPPPSGGSGGDISEN